ncbi:MAG: nicotinamide mononucleotide transporter [Methylibium sp.]|uniref:nicotinamide riboside transporter PnuC n=1 Tax=Methylibium sp. TaxID=2067992 RepID=UPI00182AEE91|nr:nicotinamide riboside transporter PnuC [Methylibium sp.]MBA3598387.1 nicotinamide mononucleotide transporter [Methylibium sp.]
MLSDLVTFLNGPAFSLGALSASRAESLGAVLGVWMVLLNLRVNPAAWPLAIASSLLYLLVFWDARLYGDASLQILFVIVAFWGWWQWLRGKQADGSTLVVRHLGARGRAGALLAFALLWPAIGLLLARQTDTDVPWWDAFPTAGSVVAQVLLARKYVENWPGWLVVNVVAVGLFAYKGLWLTVGLYALFALLAVAGWRAWAQRAAVNV